MAMLDNPIGTRGFEFVSYTGDDAQALGRLFDRMGIPAIARHKSRNLTIHQSGKVTFLINDEPAGHAGDFRAQHGSGANAMAFRVTDAEKAYAEALNRGATAVEDADDPIRARAIEAIGGSRIYFVDDAVAADFYHNEFDVLSGNEWNRVGPSGLEFIDHLTHNVHRGQMKVWADFYERIFNFREIRHFDIEGKKTGLHSKAMTSPCGHIRIPLNESQDEKSQIEEFLREYNGEGIQHIALSASDIYEAIPMMRRRGIHFQDTPDTYYELLPSRLPEHREDVGFLKNEKILVDGGEAQGGGFLLQIFTQNVIGPIFFEIIQRKGNEGFGEGNFQALFESIELDQERRGVI